MQPRSIFYNLNNTLLLLRFGIWRLSRSLVTRRCLGSGISRRTATTSSAPSRPRGTVARTTSLMSLLIKVLLAVTLELTSLSVESSTCSNPLYHQLKSLTNRACMISKAFRDFESSPVHMNLHQYSWIIRHWIIFHL